MKKIIVILSLTLAITMLAATTNTSRSLLFAGSYMLRARVCDANYWNPALLNGVDDDIWLPALNLGVSVANNSLDLDLYNYVMDRDVLEVEDKDKIMAALQDAIKLEVGTNVSLFGFTAGKFALTSTLDLAVRASFDEDYVHLLLYGNGDGSEVYEFTEDKNYVEGLSWIDLTLGMGDIRLPLPSVIPDIKFGLSASLLAGAGEAHTEQFLGTFSTTLGEGLNLSQEVLQKTGLGGYGFKSLAGLYSEPVGGLKVGLTVDNIFGFVDWGYELRDFQYVASADSVYIADLEEDTGDIFTDEYTELDGSSYTTRIPPEMRLAAMYSLKPVSLSVDYIQGFGISSKVSKQGRLAFGAEFTPLPVLPIQIGFTTGHDDMPWRISYGLGLRTGAVEFGLGVQSVGSLLPGYSAKGVAASTYLDLRF